MGISSKGEMTKLTDIVRPNVAVITNVGPSHLEFLKSVEEVAEAKLEMVTTLDYEIPLVVNADNELLVKTARKTGKRLVTFGLEKEADFKADSIESTDKGSKVTIEGNTFLIGLYGRHPVYNLLAAYAACRTLGYEFANVDCPKIKLSASAMRGELIEKNGVKIINDAYNANPESMKAGLEAFKEMPAEGRRGLILGDMLELGESSEKYHRELGQALAGYSFEFALIVGNWSEAVLEGAKEGGVDVRKLRGFKSSTKAAERVNEFLKPGDVVYVKGSRGVALEKIIDKIGEAGGKS
jgi:UDP-N-acetylmuramoyl-tripeptide--D-alanyl-D-alanine ligase